MMHLLQQKLAGAWLLAQTPTSGVFRAWEFDVPEQTWEWFLVVGGLAAVLVWSVWLYRKDVRWLWWPWKFSLTGLRLLVLAALAVIAFNPHERTQKMAFRPSRVAILADVSLSMRHSVGSPSADDASSGEVKSRSAAVRELLENSQLLADLRRQHQVSLYTFDRQLTGPHHIWSWQQQNEIKPETTDADAAEPAEQPVVVDWETLLGPQGLETRLGEVLAEAVRTLGGPTLSGVVVLTDGASNAGLDPLGIPELAKARQVRLFPIGTGGTELPANIQVARVIAPTDVHLGDGFELTALVRGQGVAGQAVQVQLLEAAEDQKEPTVIESKDIVFPETDLVPQEVGFSLAPAVAGTVKYVVRVIPRTQLADANASDDQLEHEVRIFDRPTRVFIIAGGPMRDYRFVRNMLYRHPAVSVNVWLQTSAVGMSQDADELLFEFPSREALFEYDVVLAFDPDWQSIAPEKLKMLAEWVATQGGGMIYMAGDVHTHQLAEDHAELEPIRDLSPVVLTSHLVDLLDDEAGQPRRIEWTPEGKSAGFLQLAEDPVLSRELWTAFPGIYRCYPTRGSKSGATIYAHFPDPTSQTEYGFPILLASQFFGEGRILYIGSGEIWRLRALDEEYYDRFWIKAIREVGQARMQRGTKRGTIVLERNEYLLGQTVNLRVRMLDPQYRPLQQQSVSLEVFDPRGRPFVPAKSLQADPQRPGEFTGNFRAAMPGEYRLELPIPGTSESAQARIMVKLPRLEDEVLQQNVKLLKTLAEETGGKYLPIEQAAAELPPLLPSRGEEFLVDERLRPLWDRGWVMYGLIGLLSLEWLIRKLLKLA